MNISTILNQVFILFVIMFIGFICRRANILSKETNRGLTNFLVYITLPFTIVSSFNQEYPGDILKTAGIIFIYAFFVHLASMLLGKLFYMKFEEGARNVLWFGTVFSNCGFMGFPVMESLYGKIGVFYASIYVVVFTLFLWTFGVMVFSGARDFRTIKRAVLNPGIIAVLIGIIIFLFPIRQIYILSRSIDIMGSLTTPLSMIIIGATLAEIDLRYVFSGFHIYLGSLVRLVIIPGIAFIALKLLGAGGMVLGVCVISTAMPVAANCVIFAEKFNGDAKLASRMVLVSTIVSIVTIPAVIILTGV